MLSNFANCLIRKRTLISKPEHNTTFYVVYIVQSVHRPEQYKPVDCVWIVFLGFLVIIVFLDAVFKFLCTAPTKVVKTRV